MVKVEGYLCDWMLVSSGVSQGCKERSGNACSKWQRGVKGDVYIRM